MSGEREINIAPHRYLSMIFVEEILQLYVQVIKWNNLLVYEDGLILLHIDIFSIICVLKSFCNSPCVKMKWFMAW